MGDAMEPISPDAMLGGQLIGQGVGSGDRRHRAVEGRIEDRDHRDHWAQNRSGSLNALETSGIVQRCQLAQRVDLLDDAVIDDDGIRKAFTPVDDTVADSLDLRQ